MYSVPETGYVPARLARGDACSRTHQAAAAAEPTGRRSQAPTCRGGRPPPAVPASGAACPTCAGAAASAAPRHARDRWCSSSAGGCGGCCARIAEGRRMGGCHWLQVKGMGVGKVGGRRGGALGHVGEARPSTAAHGTTLTGQPWPEGGSACLPDGRRGDCRVECWRQGCVWEGVAVDGQDLLGGGQHLQRRRVPAAA